MEKIMELTTYSGSGVSGLGNGKKLETTVVLGSI